MKKLLATLFLGVVLGVAALPASALGTAGEVTLTAKADGAAVSLSVPQEEGQGVTALSLSFQIQGESVNGADFDFADNLNSTVQKATYNAAENRLNVYVAGKQELLSSGTLDLGRITVDAPQGTQVEISVVSDSFQMVNSAFGKTANTTAQGTTATVTMGQDQSSGGSSGSGSSSGNAGSSATSQSVTATATPAPTATPDPAQSTGTTVTTGGQTASGTSGGKGTGSTQGTPSPSASPEPSQEPQSGQEESTSTPAPETSQEVATPEQTQTTEKGMNLPLIAAIVAAVLAAAVLIGVVVIRLRNR